VGEGGRPADATAVNFLTSAVRIAVAVFGVLTVLSRWVQDITGLITGLGIGGLALALAAQDTASSLFGSISLLLDRPFEVGDWIEATGIEGKVERIGMRSSRIRTADQSLVFLPNSKLAAQSIKNCSKRGKRRVTFKIGIAGDTEAEALNTFLNKIREILKADNDILPDVTVAFDSFGDGKLGIQVGYHTVCTDTSAMLLVNERVNFKLLDAARTLGIRM
jgi:MscS family membrane protein